MLEPPNPKDIGGNIMQKIDIEKQELKEAESEPVAAPDGTGTLEQTSARASEADTRTAVAADTGEDVYDRISPRRKNLITVILSLCGFLAPIGSTTLLPAVPHIAATFNTTGTIINLSNGLYVAAMAASPVFYGPLSQTYGRRWIYIVALSQFFAFSIGSALVPNLASFFAFRILTAFQGCCLLIVGASCIGDMFRPTERATALSWFMSGTLIGPALGPIIGGIIVTFKTWRDIFWFQSAISGLSLVLVIAFVPETIHKKRGKQLEGLTFAEYAKQIWKWTSPWRVIKLYKYPNLLIVGMSASALVWNMYSLLTPIGYVLNPRFHLTSPIQSSLFYIPPGAGYLVGTLFGGRWADYVVRRWIKKRGRRVPEDRLRSALTAMFVVAACMVVYGWSVEKAVGGIPLPVIVMFIQGVAQLFCFPSLNTYCLDVMQGHSAEVVAGNYLFRYSFAAAGSALCLPAIQKIGVGWFSTASAAFIIIMLGFTILLTERGEQMRAWIDGKEESE